MIVEDLKKENTELKTIIEKNEEFYELSDLE